jgi:ketosteroid isomerase-like protein
LDFKPTHIEVASGGDMAFDFGVVYFAPNPKPDDLENIAKYLVVWKREHGHWKVLYDCWNYNHMVPPT